MELDPLVGSTAFYSYIHGILDGKGWVYLNVLWRPVAASWILIHSHSKAGPSFEGALTDVRGKGDHKVSFGQAWCFFSGKFAFFLGEPFRKWESLELDMINDYNVYNLIPNIAPL